MTEFLRWIWSSLLPPSNSIAFLFPPVLSRSASDLAVLTPVFPLPFGGRLADVATTRILLFHRTIAAEAGLVLIPAAGFLLHIMLYWKKRRTFEAMSEFHPRVFKNRKRGFIIAERNGRFL